MRQFIVTSALGIGCCVAELAARAQEALPTPEELPAPAAAAADPAASPPAAPGRGDAPQAAAEEAPPVWRDLLQLLLLACREQAVPDPLLPCGTIVSLSTNVEPETVEIVFRRLSDEKFLAMLECQAPGLAMLVPALEAGGPIFRSMRPEVQCLIARPRQDENAAVLPKPTLPALAFVFTPRDIKKAKSQLLSTYWGVMAAANQMAKAEGKPRFLLHSERRGEAFFASARVDDQPLPAEADRVRYNFSPAIGIVDNRFIITTDRWLGSELVDLARKQPLELVASQGPRINLGPRAGVGLILDNVEQQLSENRAPDPWTRASLQNVAGILRNVRQQLPERQVARQARPANPPAPRRRAKPAPTSL